MQKQTLVLILVVLNYSYGQQKDELEKLPDQQYEKCGEGSQKGTHMCVSYYLCHPKSKTIISIENYNGPPLLDKRIGGDYNTCEDYLQVCCKIQNNVVSNEK